MALQTLELSRKSGKDDEMARLRKLIPDPILAHYDRLIARGKKGVSVLRRGVCAECHIRVPTGTLVTLAKGVDIQLCGSCGRYLYLSAEELAAATPQPPAPRRTRKPREAAPSQS